MRYALAVAATLLAAKSAHAFVRTEGCNATRTVCSELSWPSNCATYALDAAAQQQTGISFAALQQIIDDAFAAWDNDATGCSFLDVVSEAPVSGEEVGFVGEGAETNVITFVTSGWEDLPGSGHDPGAIALTSVFFDPESGAIVTA